MMPLQNSHQNTISDHSSDIAMVVGYLVISRPFLDVTNKRQCNSTYSERLEVSDWYTNIQIQMPDFGNMSMMH